MRRGDREIADRAEIDEVLRSNYICHLAMVDGEEPYVVPMVYGYDGEALYFHSAMEGRKVGILRRNDRVCFEVCGPFAPAEATSVCRKGSRFISVIGAGRVSFISEPAERAAAMDLILGQVYGAGASGYDPDKLGRVLIIKVTVTSVSGKRA